MNLRDADCITVESVKVEGRHNVAQLVRETESPRVDVRVAFRVRYERYSSRN